MRTLQSPNIYERRRPFSSLQSLNIGVSLPPPRDLQNNLSFGIPNVDDSFPSFNLGDFTVLYGHPSCLTLSLILCVRSQLPKEKGGLDSSVLFLDGGNSFDPYTVTSICREYGLDPKSVLEKIFISRAFTAYQLTSLIFDKLSDALNKYSSKVVVISNIAHLFYDSDVPKTEEQDLFNKLTLYLSNLASKTQTIILATSLSQPYSFRSIFLQSALLGRASAVMRIKEAKDGLKFMLEKHPTIKPLTADFPSSELTLENFMAG